MVIKNLHNILLPDGSRSICYDEPNADINSPDFRKEHCLPKNGLLTELPFSTNIKECQWGEREIREAIDCFMDDRCKSGPLYDPTEYTDILRAIGITDPEQTRQFLLYLLELVEKQFGTVPDFYY